MRYEIQYRIEAKMAIQNVKITELDPVDFLKETDLFLLADPIYNTDGGIITNNRYTSNSLSGGALKHSIENYKMEIGGHWKFKGGPDNIPEQTTKLETSGFVDALKTPEKLNSLTNDSNPNGWYYGLSSSIIQKENDGTSDSLSVLNSSIPNVDFVQRAIAGAYKVIIDQLTNIITPTGSAGFIPSHIGQIIVSTTLSTASDELEEKDNPNENNVRRYYGYGQNINGVQYPDTKWIQHYDCFLRGNTSNVMSNDNVLTSNSHGGTDTQSYDVPLKSHDHALGNKFSDNATVTGKVTAGGWLSTTTTEAERPSVPRTVITKVTLHGSEFSISNGRVSFNANAKTETSGDSEQLTITHLPKYKNVYIWERIA